MRTPQEIVMTIAYSLKDGKIGDEYSIADISKSTKLHYMTTGDYLNLIEYIQENIPKIKKIDSIGKAKIVIMDELESDYSQKEKVLLTMFDKAAFSKDSAYIIKDLEECIKDIISEGLAIKSTDAKYYLTTKGIIDAANLAEKRSEKITNLSSNSKEKCVDFEFKNKEGAWHKCEQNLEEYMPITKIDSIARCSLPSFNAA